MIKKLKTFDDFQEYAQLLLATRIFNEFMELRAAISAIRRQNSSSKRKFSDFPTEDIEPESYAENWIKEYVVGGDEDFRDGAFSYFIKLLANYPKAKR